MDLLSQPDGLKGDLPLDVENYDALPFFLSALPISASVVGIQVAHEVGHRVAAFRKKVRII